MRVQYTYAVQVTYDVPGDRRRRAAKVRASSTERAILALRQKLAREVRGYSYVSGTAEIV